MPTVNGYRYSTQVYRTVRVKWAVNGVFEDDPDIVNPAVSLPNPLVSADPSLAFAWRMRKESTGPNVKMKVIFRDANDMEVLGTYAVYAFGIVPVMIGETVGSIDTARPSVEYLGNLDGVASKPMILSVCSQDIFGLRLSAINAPGATRAIIGLKEI